MLSRIVLATLAFSATPQAAAFAPAPTPTFPPDPKDRNCDIFYSYCGSHLMSMSGKTVFSLPTAQP